MPSPVPEGVLIHGTSIQWFTTACTLPFAVLLITGGRLGDIAGRRRMSVIGGDLATLSGWSWEAIVAGLLALGPVSLGVGLFGLAFFTIALQPLRPQGIGSAAGRLNAVQQLGATLGVPALGSVYLGNAAYGGPSAALHAVQVAFWVAVALVAVSFGITRLMMAPKGLSGGRAGTPR
ncbi:hypothetical protein [Streptomyces paromomycinus]|uniref:Putative actinorhodin transporter n=1 Tax=Streptomyces paromomycinus TaxID=92743 RepID=A0A401VU57_STREY|nr:hypothetical protein [Streptomyces paromomycinus]GCD40582.1 putative actinorhodin transporter [Streptomyces paromomycinus]